MRSIVVIALLGAALALSAQLVLSADAPAAPAADAKAPAAGAAATDPKAAADPKASATAEAHASDKSAVNGGDVPASSEEEDDIGADPPQSFFGKVVTVLGNIVMMPIDFFKSVVKLPSTKPDYVEGEFCMLTDNDGAFRSINATTRAGCAKRGLNCEWKTEFGQPLILAAHPMFGEKVGMHFYGLDASKLPATVTGKEFAEDSEWVTKLLGTSKEPGMCNSFKAGDDDKVQYAACYSGAFKSSLYVHEILTPQSTTFGCKDGCVRFDKFVQDSRLGPDQLTSDDWTGTQMDRGHLAPNADANTTPQRMCTFYVSNIFFQTDKRNRLVWAAMEDGLRDAMYDKKKFSPVQFDKIHIWNSLVFTLPGVPGADQLYTITTKRKNVVPVPYFAFKFVIALKGKSALVNICFLDNPDPKSAGSKAGTLATPYQGSHVHNCPKSSDNAKAHCVGLDDPRNLDEISPCFEASAVHKITVKELVKASQLDFAPVMAQIKAKGFTPVTNAKLSEWQG